MKNNGELYYDLLSLRNHGHVDATKGVNTNENRLSGHVGRDSSEKSQEQKRLDSLSSNR